MQDTAQLSDTTDAETLSLKIPPHSIEAEASILGGVLLDNDIWEKVSELVYAEDFYRKEHNIIFTAIAALDANGDPYDVVTVAEWLENHQQLEARCRTHALFQGGNPRPIGGLEAARALRRSHDPRPCVSSLPIKVAQRYLHRFRTRRGASVSSHRAHPESGGRDRKRLLHFSVPWCTRHTLSDRCKRRRARRARAAESHPPASTCPA